MYVLIVAHKRTYHPYVTRLRPGTQAAGPVCNQFVTIDIPKLPQVQKISIRKTFSEPSGNVQVGLGLSVSLS